MFQQPQSVDLALFQVEERHTRLREEARRTRMLSTMRTARSSMKPVRAAKPVEEINGAIKGNVTDHNLGTERSARQAFRLLHVCCRRLGELFISIGTRLLNFGTLEPVSGR